MLAPHTLHPGRHLDFTARVLAAAGAAEADARMVAEALLWADLRGRCGQGLERLPILARRLARGLLRSPAPMEWSTLGPAARRLDAAFGFGHVAGRLAIARAVEVAREQTVGLVVVHRSIHYGAAGYFCALAADAGCAALAATNAVAKVAPFGGARAALGTNPLAFGCPGASGAPLLIDLATSALAGSELRSLAAAEGRLPEGAALDASGRPTRDPAAASAGCLLPLGGAKGFALALMVEVLSGVLSGASVGSEVGSLLNTWDRPIDVGHMFLAVDVARFMPLAEFRERMGRLAAGIKATPPLDPESPVRLPGEEREALAEVRARDGIPLDRWIRKVVADMVAEFEVEEPW